MIFVDTSAWIAIEDKRDTNHPKALIFIEELLSLKVRLFTTNYILDETYTLMLMDVGYSKTLDFKSKLDQLIENNLLIKFFITQEIEQLAWTTFENFNKDKTWSFTDCTSKVTMDRFSITNVFAFDKHFEQMKFLRKP